MTGSSSSRTMIFQEHRLLRARHQRTERARWSRLRVLAVRASRARPSLAQQAPRLRSQTALRRPLAPIRDCDDYQPHHPVPHTHTTSPHRSSSQDGFSYHRRRLPPDRHPCRHDAPWRPRNPHREQLRQRGYRPEEGMSGTTPVIKWLRGGWGKMRSGFDDERPGVAMIRPTGRMGNCAGHIGGQPRIWPKNES